MKLSVLNLFPDQLELPGFTIPIREMSEEEYLTPITLERFNDFHHEVGEDFCDQVGYLIDPKVYGGFLLHKYPNKNTEILEALVDKDMISYQNVYDFSSVDWEDVFYSDLSEFLNLTILTKARVNQVLIQIAEHYE